MQQTPLVNIEKYEVHNHYNVDLSEVLHKLHLINQKISQLMTKEELQQGLIDLKAQADKAKQEILDKVKSLEDAIKNADNVPNSVVNAFNDLKGSVQALDDLNPDQAAGGDQAQG